MLFHGMVEGSLTLYGDAIHGPLDAWLGRAAGPAHEHPVLSRGQDEISGSAADPVWSGWKTDGRLNHSAR